MLARATQLARFLSSCALLMLTHAAYASPKIAVAVPVISSSGAAMPSPFAGKVSGMNSLDLGALFDKIIPAQLTRNDIAGAVVAVVREGEIVFVKGYGYADVASRKPVSATDTLFRIGSVSKLMTWTAVMQLVEQGKIDLDTNINQYLDFQIPDAFGKFITMRNLMTHTAGFEDTYQGMWVPDAKTLVQLHDYLLTRLPARIFSPGTVSAYSNYGAALAGYIVQRVSGEQFSTYIERHITNPLQMSHTTFAQPLPTALAPLMSTGYQLASTPPKPFELIQGPTGGASSSAADMARFMIAHLQRGSLDGVQILKPETVANMHAVQHAFDPRDNAMGLGWVDGRYNGRRIIGHDGATFFFHSNLNLIPDAQVGLFVAYNSSGNGKGGTLGPVFRAFMDRYFPYNAAPIQALRLRKGSTAHISGSYMPSRRGQSNMAYLAAVLGQTKVSMNDDDTISMNDFMSAKLQLMRWRETEPGYWQDIAGQQNHLIFKQDPNGQWQFSDGNPTNIYQRVAWYQGQAVVLTLLAFSIGTCIISLLIWPVVARRQSQAKTNRSQVLTQFAAATNVLMWGASAALMAFAVSHLELISGAWFDILLRFMQLIGWLAAFGIISILWISCQAWRAKRLSGWAGVHRALVLLACLASLWIAWFANLLALNVRY